jgi:hypothetical protein
VTIDNSAIERFKKRLTIQNRLDELDRIPGGSTWKEAFDLRREIELLDQQRQRRNEQERLRPLQLSPELRGMMNSMAVCEKYSSWNPEPSDYPDLSALSGREGPGRETAVDARKSWLTPLRPTLLDLATTIIGGLLVLWLWNLVSPA